MNENIIEIIKYLGGAENIIDITNCMTRLRVTVKNEDENIDVNKLKTLQDVLSVVHGRKNKYEIVLGPGKCKKYADALRSMGIGKTKNEISANKSSSVKSFMRIIGDIFVPLIPGVITAGLCAGFASLISNIYPDYAGHKTLRIVYEILTLVSASFMSYITAWAGYRAAERFGATPIMGGMLGMITSLEGINKISSILGLYNEKIPLSSILYAGKGGVLAVIFGVYVLSLAEKKIRKFMPASLDIILTPLFSIIICVIPYIAFIMPAFGYISSGIAAAVSRFCFSESIAVRAVIGYISSAIFLPLVASGMHHGLVGLYIVQLEELGYITLYPSLAMAGAGQVGAAFAVMNKARRAGNLKLSKLAANGIPAGILGIGEPLIYGVTLPLGKPFILAGLGAGFGGALVMAMQVASTTWGPSGIVGVFVMTAGANGALQNSIIYLLSLGLAYIGGYLMTELFVKDSELTMAG